MILGYLHSPFINKSNITTAVPCIECTWRCPAIRTASEWISSIFKYCPMDETTLLRSSSSDEAESFPDRVVLVGAQLRQ